MILGAVLAGGAGRRMGGPKGGVAVEGLSLVERAVGTLLAVPAAGGPDLAEVVVVGRGDTPPPAPGVPVIHDLHPGRGPVAGLHAALVHAGAHGMERVFLLACDLPLVPPGVVSRVLRAAHRDRIAVPVSSGPLGFEPLCALYPLAVLAWVEEVLMGARSERGWSPSMAELVRALEPVDRVDPGPARGEGGAEHPGFFLNVNRPHDVEVAARWLRRVSPRTGGDADPA